ncbi:MAG TPA: hypothetical protein VI456_12835 [Polyangia bacterium]
MDRVADIISIASRRRLQPPAGPAAVPHTPVRSPRGVAALVGAALVFVAAVAISGVEFGRSVRDLPLAARNALYRRSLEDLESACTLPAAREGALREHCLGQARFLLTFPECDAQCQRASASILPHAHR